MTFVRYEVAEGVATVTLDSPHNRNALSAGLVSELEQGLLAAADPGVRAVVLTHTGGTFCAGADLTAPGLMAAALPGLLRAILELPKPVVARIDGHVRAGGMGLVGACDMVVAGPSSTFALTEARLGLAPSIISLTVLPRLTSRAAGRYFLTGEKFGAAEALDVGLVTVAASDVGEATDLILGQLRLASPQGLAASKALTTAAMLAEFDRSAERLAAESARLFGSEEAKEGMEAFLSKRPPPWAL